MSEFLRYYRGYTLRSAMRELSFRQVVLLIEEARKRPYDYTCLVEPKK